jgi:hypothetical protein
MNRREFLGALAAASGNLPMQGLAAPTDLRSAAREAWLFCLPLIESARVRAQSAQFAPDGRGGEAINAFAHLRELATPAFRLVTSPNVDTLYSLAFIDLGNGPATITLPETGERYFSLHLMDMYTNSFAVLGTRTTGGDGGTFMLVGPRDLAPDGAIRVPTPWIWAIARIGVSGPEDIDPVHKIQDGILLKASPARGLGSFAQRNSAWGEYFASASVLLAENPPRATDLAVLHRIAPLGLGSRGFDAAKFTATEAHEIEAGIADAKSIVAGARIEKPLNGWRYPSPDLGDFGQNYLFRAQIAIIGLAALPRQEAMYMRAVAADGSINFQDGNWRLNFARDQLPPVDAFWSLTMYETTPQGQYFLTENPLHRYAIGDRTKGMRRNPDGSLDIWIARKDPGSGRTENWLPAPASGPFSLSMRAYLPKSEFLAGAYQLPPIMPA